MDDEGSDVEPDDCVVEERDDDDELNDETARLRSPVVSGAQERRLIEWSRRSLLSVTSATRELMKQVTANRLHDEADDGSGSDEEDVAKGSVNDPFEEFVPPDESRPTGTRPSHRLVPCSQPDQGKITIWQISLGNLGSAIVASRWRVKAGLGGATPVTTRDERRKARQKLAPRWRATQLR